MAVDYGFFQSRNGDRKYSDVQFANYYAPLVSNGVILSSTSALQVSESANMTLNISAGRAMIEGRWFAVIDGETVTIPNANGIYTRYDRVVIRCDYAERKCSIVVLSGVPAAVPLVPDIVRDGTYFDLSLCTILVGVGVTKITNAVITDTRGDNAVCGYVTGLIDQIDTTTLFQQFFAQWNDFVLQLGENDNVTINFVDYELRDNVLQVKKCIPLSQMIKFV